MDLKKKVETAVWIGKSLFERGKTAGATANMSFVHEDKVYITGTGTCFGTLDGHAFSVLDRQGNHLSGIKPSKEYPLHLDLLNSKPELNAVLHTHSFHCVLWSCLEHKNPSNCIPAYTPYLKMRLGTVGVVPYAKPGSEELFQLFRKRIGDSDGYLLANHGPVVGAQDLMAAFYALEELEESARVAWTLRGEKVGCV